MLGLVQCTFDFPACQREQVKGCPTGLFEGLTAHSKSSILHPRPPSSHLCRNEFPQSIFAVIKDSIVHRQYRRHMNRQQRPLKRAPLPKTPRPRSLGTVQVCNEVLCLSHECRGLIHCKRRSAPNCRTGQRLLLPAPRAYERPLCMPESPFCSFYTTIRVRYLLEGSYPLRAIQHISQIGFGSL